MKKIAIIGASYLQDPLIKKAKSLGIETHAFAWEADDVGEKSADFFYPISITEKEEILRECRRIGIDGICSIASDLAVETVNYVATSLGLTGNSMESSALSTNKRLMKRAFASGNVPTPCSREVCSIRDLDVGSLTYPVIVKPVDRSGSRGITELFSVDGLEAAIDTAISYGFEKKALVEDFAFGREYSIECMSWHGRHELLAITTKYTTGTPHFIETGHLQPSDLDGSVTERIRDIVFHALDVLKVEFGASHSELKIDDDGNISMIEIGARAGGDCICSSLVELSTGIDFLKAVIDTALGVEPVISRKHQKASAIKYILNRNDYDNFMKLRSENPGIIVDYGVDSSLDTDVTDSSSRHGYYIMSSDNAGELIRILES